MPDISLPPLVTPPQNLRNAGALKILDLPPDLRALASPQRLGGEVVARLPDQSIILRTTAGDIRLQNNNAPKLQPGDKLVVELPAGQPPRLATLRPASPNLPPLPPIGTAPTPPQSGGPVTRPPVSIPIPIEDGAFPVPPPRGTVSTALPPRLPLGQVLRLTPVPTPSLLPPPPVSIPVTARPTLPPPVLPSPQRADLPLQIPTPPPFSGGVALEGVPVRPLSAMLPPQLRLPPPLNSLLPPPDPETPQPTLPLTSRSLPAQVPGHVAQDVKVMATLPPLPAGLGLPDETALTLLRPGQQLAVVTTLTARQQPVLTLLSPHGKPVAQQPPMILHYPTQSLPIGTRVILSAPQAQALPPVLLTPTPSFLPNFSPGAWPAFTQILLLAGASLSPLLERQFPRVGATAQAAQFTGPATLLLSLMRGGTLDEGYFVPAAQQGDMARQGVLKALQSILQDIAQTQSQSVQDQDGQSWRPMPLPILTDMGQVERAILYIPHHVPDGQKKADQKDKKKAVRFMLAARLSRMGDMQLEGLYREEAKALDLQVASEHPFSGPARTHIAQVYASALTRSDLSGEIFFHLKNSHWRDFSHAQAEPTGSITA